jgi:hypothetical protein
MAGIGKLPAPALGGWYFGWYFWYCTFRREPSFDELARTLFLKNLAGTLLPVRYYNFWQQPSFDEFAGTPFFRNLAGTPLRVSHLYVGIR